MLSLLLALAVTASAAAPAARPAAGESEFLTAAEYHSGLNRLRGYMDKRGEDAAASERFIRVMDRALSALDERHVPVTRGVFERFTRYQAAWARKTRDSKNPNVTPRQLEQERARAAGLKEEFRLAAMQDSPEFYRVFQAAVRDVRRAPTAAGRVYQGDSSVFFADQVDDSYTRVDAGDVALEKGDYASARREAEAALRANPANADAFVLRGGASYAEGDLQGAARDAQSALVLDPRNEQAQALLALTGPAPEASSALQGAAADAGSLAQDGAAAHARLAAPAGGSWQAAVGLGAGGERSAGLDGGSVYAGPASPTPAVGQLLSREFTALAAARPRSEAVPAVAQLDRAIRLDPGNKTALNWKRTLLNVMGEYGAALGSLKQDLAGGHASAEDLFNEAYALAGQGRRDAAVAAISEAARLDPQYTPLAEDALRNPQDADLTTLFGDYAAAHRPRVASARKAGTPPALLALGAVGVGLMAAGGWVLVKPRKRRR